MKNPLRPFGLILALSSLLLLMLSLSIGCSDRSETSSDASSDTSSVSVSSSDADMTATLLEIYSKQDRFDRLEELIPVLRGLTASQVVVIPEVLELADLAYREDARILMIATWSRHDPKAATKWAMRGEFVEFARSSMFDETAYRWALADPNGFVTDMDVAVYSSRGWDKAMLRAMVRGWYESGQPQLEAFIFDMGRNRDDRQRAMSELIRVKLAREGADAMIAWSGGLSGDLNYKQYARDRLAGDIARIDPARAVAWCDEICDRDGDSMVSWIAGEWAEKHGEDAMDWVASRPNSIASRIGARSAYRKFLLNSPDRAIAWVEATTKEQRSNPILVGPIDMFVTQRSAKKMYSVAIEWAGYIVDERTRNQALINNTRRWLRYDKEAAETWLAESSLPENIKPFAYQRGMIPNSVYKTE